MLIIEKYYKHLNPDTSKRTYQRRKKRQIDTHIIVMTWLQAIIICSQKLKKKFTRDKEMTEAVSAYFTDKFITYFHECVHKFIDRSEKSVRVAGENVEKKLYFPLSLYPNSSNIKTSP